MKYKLAAFFIVLGCISLYYSAQSFDDDVIGSFWSYDSSFGSRTISLIGEEIDNDKYEEFLTDFILLLDEYNLNAYSVSGDNFRYVIFCYSSDTKYSNSINLENNNHPILTENIEYSSFSQETDTRIYTMILDQELILTPLDINHKDFSFSQVFHITANEDTESEYPVDNYELICSRLNEKYDSNVCIANYMDVTVHTHEDSLWMQWKETLEKWEMFFPLILLLVFTVNSSIVNATNEIAKRKLEGHSSFSLFYDYFLKYVFVGFVLLFVAYYVFVNYFIPLEIAKLNVFINELALNSIIVIALLFLVAFLVFYEIFKVPLNIAMKGKSHARVTIDVLRLLKCVTIVISLPMFIVYSHNIFSYAEGLLVAKEKKEMYHNMYSITFYRNVYFEEYLVQDNSEKMETVLNTLENDNSAVYFSVAWDTEEDVERNYVVSASWISMQGWSHERPLETTVFLHESQEERDIRAKLLEYYGEYMTVKHDDLIVNRDIVEDLFYSPLYINNGNFIYDANSDLNAKNDIYKLQFYFEGDLGEAQNYLDQLLLENEMPSFFVLESLENVYDYYAKLAFNLTIVGVIYCLTFLTTLLMLSKQTIELDRISNSKQYFLEYIEGNRIGYFMYSYILPSIVVWSFAQAVFFLFYRDFYMELLPTVIILGLIDIAISFSHQRKNTANTIKGGNI